MGGNVLTFLRKIKQILKDCTRGPPPKAQNEQSFKIVEIFQKSILYLYIKHGNLEMFLLSIKLRSNPEIGRSEVVDRRFNNDSNILHCSYIFPSSNILMLKTTKTNSQGKRNLWIHKISLKYIICSLKKLSLVHKFFA